MTLVALGAGYAVAKFQLNRLSGSSGNFNLVFESDGMCVCVYVCVYI